MDQFETQYYDNIWVESGGEGRETGNMCVKWWLWSSGGLWCLVGHTSEQNIDLLFDPLLIIGRIGIGVALIDQTTQISQLVDEVKELWDVVCDGRDVRISALQVLLIDMTDTLHGLVHRLEVTVRPGVRFARLDQHYAVRHRLQCGGNGSVQWCLQCY